MKKIFTLLLPATLSVMPVFLQAENLLPAPEKMLLVQGTRQKDGTILPKANKKAFVTSLRSRLKHVSAAMQFSGTITGNVHGVWAMLLANNKKKKVFQKGIWLDPKQMIRDKDGKLHFAGTIDCSEIVADEIYFYFESYSNNPTPVKIEKLSLETPTE